MVTKAFMILSAFQLELKNILVSNGYQTDAGKVVFLGRTVFDQNQPTPFIAITEGPEDSERELGDEARENKLTVIVEAITKPDKENPLPDIDMLAGDIKKKIGAGFQSLNGLTTRYRYLGRETSPPESGSQFGGVSFTFEVYYYENVADPYEVD